MYNQLWCADLAVEKALRRFRIITLIDAEFNINLKGILKGDKLFICEGVRCRRFVARNEANNIGVN